MPTCIYIKKVVKKWEKRFEQCLEPDKAAQVIDGAVTALGAVLDREDCRKVVVCNTCSAIKNMVPAAQVVIVMLDAASGLSTQDIRLLNMAVERGRAAVIAVNKWDGLEDKQREKLHAELVKRIGAFDYLPLLFISALQGSGLRDLMDAIQASHRAAFAELSTNALSRTLEDAVEGHSPPAIHGRRIKLRYAHQGGRNPPTIVIHGNQTQRLSDEYKRYLMRRFREKFDLFGTPIHLVFKNSDNPYVQRGSKRKRS